MEISFVKLFLLNQLQCNFGYCEFGEIENDSDEEIENVPPPKIS